MQTVYIDTLFLANFIVNYLTLLCTARILALPILRLRSAVGALFGGLYAVSLYIDGLRFLGALPIKLAFGVLIALVVFGGERRFFRTVFVFFAVSAAFGGAIYAMALLRGQTPGAPTFRVLALSACAVYGVLSIVLQRAARSAAGGGLAEVELRVGPRKATLTALRDTGNSLTDPMTGKQVIVADCEAVTRLFPEEVRASLTEKLLRNPTDAFLKAGEMAPGLRLRLVPYRAVGSPGHVLLAFKTDETVIAGRRIGPSLVALSPDPVSDGGVYRALCGG